MIKKSVVKRLIKEIIWTHGHILYGILIVKGFDKQALAAWVLLSTLIRAEEETSGLDFSSAKQSKNAFKMTTKTHQMCHNRRSSNIAKSVWN